MSEPSHEPDFGRLLQVLRRQPTARPVLFEFIINDNHLRRLAGDRWREPQTPADALRNWIAAYYNGGYDFSVIAPWNVGLMRFAGDTRERAASVSMSHGGVIVDRPSFASYPWPDPDADDWSFLDQVRPELPAGMKLLVPSNCGVLENLTQLIGYEELCIMLFEDADLLGEIADAVGSRLLRYYERALASDLVGGVIVNDDWGFKTQIFLAPDQMRRFITPWHRKIVALAHAAGRPAILHSCGQLETLWEDIIQDLRFDGKHSYEDAILPVEQAYDRYGDRIAILGGLDLDFLCQATPEKVHARATALLARTAARGGYALGSGNSIADYVPAANFDAMRRAAADWR